MRTIAIDFDGVLHAYTSGWTGPVPIDDPVPGAQTFCRELQRLGWVCVVYTARISSVHEDAEVCKAEVRAWLSKHDFPWMEIVAEKPPAVVYVDDRAYRFQGDFTQALSFITSGKSRKPWNKK